jgi:hypothetical protein
VSTPFQYIFFYTDGCVTPIERICGGLAGMWPYLDTESRDHDGLAIHARWRTLGLAPRLAEGARSHLPPSL